MHRISPILVSALFLILIFSGCHRKAVPVITARTNFPEVPKPTRPVVSPASPEFIAAGKTIYEGKCTRCHDLKTPDIYNGERWNTILQSMIPRAKLNDEEAQQITAYVMANAKK